MCFGSRERNNEDEGARSRELDKVIRADEKRMAKEVKLLLLGMPSDPLESRRGVLRWRPLTSSTTGAGESGKSTVLKQMKLIYAQGFSKTEKLEWKTVVFNNIIQSFRLIFDAMQELDIEFELKENEASFPSRRVRDREHKPRVTGDGRRTAG